QIGKLEVGEQTSVAQALAMKKRG
ncbi:MAG: hypothetical protein K0S03_1021, partial [Burkholderiales bacterium]|nr:hypothetical protein [Burkholderiales bacterium]